MKRKIIITESQYIKLQELLFETADVNDTLDYVKAGDVLLFKGPYNIKINVVNVDQNTGEILGTTDKNEKVKFFFNSYDENTKKFNFQKLDNTTKKYVNQPFDVKELDILRNGSVLPIRDANKKPTPPPPPPPPPTTDDTSKTIELDPSITTNPEVLKTAGEEARKKIDYSKDPLLKKAFHRQAGFWDQFRAELAGKSSESSGIKSVLNMLGKYSNKKVKDKFGDTFTYNKRAKFKIISRTLLGNNYTTYEYLVRSWTEGDADTITLSEPNNPTGLKLIVNERKKNETDVYECTLKAIINGKEQEENVEVRFEKSAGYEPPITGKEPIKNPNK